MKRNLASGSVILFLIPSILAAKPTNYDECILENISNAQTNSAVGAVKRACRSLFPEPEFVPIPVQIIIESWRTHYNTKRPHSALGYRPAAPQAIILMDQRPIMH